MAGIDEDGRIGSGEQDRQPVERPAGRGRADDGGDREEIEREGAGLPDGERHTVGHQRQRRRDEEEEGRILPGVELGIRAEDRLLAGVLPGGIEGRGALAVEDQRAGGVEAREIGADRPAAIVGQALRRPDDGGEGDGREDEARKRHQADAFAGEPAPIAERGEEVLHRHFLARPA